MKMFFLRLLLVLIWAVLVSFPNVWLSRYQPYPLFVTLALTVILCFLLSYLFPDEKNDDIFS